MTRHLACARLSALLARGFMLISLIVLTGCATFPGIGGAQSPAVNSDTGTQVAQIKAQPGIGGTGKQPGIGGTGIIGTITGFGSIFINGLVVDTAPDLAIAFKDRTLRPDALRVGQVVAIEAQNAGGHLRAIALSVRHEVAGPIERIDIAQRMAVVFGQRIAIPKGVISAANGSRKISIGDLAPGDHIDVSGLRRADGVIAASRIDKTRPGEAAVLRGRVTASGQSGFSVNGVRIDAPFATRPATLASGKDVLVIGTAIRGRLSARRITLNPVRPFSGRVARVSIEGYVRRAISGGVAIGAMPISQLPARTSLQAGQRIILDGSIDTRGRIAVKRVRSPGVITRVPAELRKQLNAPPPPRRQIEPPASPAPAIRDPRPLNPPVFSPQDTPPGLPHEVTPPVFRPLDSPSERPAPILRAPPPSLPPVFRPRVRPPADPAPVIRAPLPSSPSVLSPAPGRLER